MKKVIFAIAMLFCCAISEVYAQATLEYIPQFNMQVNQLIAHGGPQYQYLIQRFRNVNWGKDLRTQEVPIVTRDEIQALYREKEMIEQLRWHYFQISRSSGYSGVGNTEYGMISTMLSNMVISNYIPLQTRLRFFTVHRPDAVR